MLAAESPAGFLVENISLEMGFYVGNPDLVQIAGANQLIMDNPWVEARSEPIPLAHGCGDAGVGLARDGEGLHAPTKGDEGLP